MRIAHKTRREAALVRRAPAHETFGNGSEVEVQRCEQRSVVGAHRTAPGEICGLRRRDLDLDHARLFVVQQRAKGGGTVNTGKTKGRRGRVVALDSRTVEALRAHLRAQGVEREQLGLGYEDHGLVFCHEDGRPLHPDSVTKRFARLVDASGLPMITVHELRHSHATLLLQAGVHPKVVQERLGHSTISVTSGPRWGLRPSVRPWRQ
jgi:integrase